MLNVTRRFAAAGFCMAILSVALSLSPCVDSAQASTHATRSFTVAFAEPADNFDWDSPQTWADLAETLGIVGAAVTLFVGWRVRHTDREDEARRERQEWGIRAAAVTTSILGVLNEPEEDDTSTEHRAERLNDFQRQQIDALTAFGALSDAGTEEQRLKLVKDLQTLIDGITLLTGDYRWMAQLRGRLREAPGDEEANQALRTTRRSAAARASEIKNELSAFRRAIGNWLAQTDSLTKERGSVLNEAA
jgi:hypothetical protein